ncbi:MAG: GNAT family protein [Verrucomicrobiota bacterium]
MHHQIQKENYEIRLRPVAMEDAQFIVSLRNSDHAMGSIHDTSASLQRQQEWLRSYYERDGDIYFIVETLCGIPIGTYGLYEFEDNTAELGRWIMLPEVPAALPSAMIALGIAFDHLGLDAIRGTVVSTNRTVRSFNRKFGFHETGILRDHCMIQGQKIDLVTTRLDRLHWPKIQAKHETLARYAGQRIRAWADSVRQLKV